MNQDSSASHFPDFLPPEADSWRELNPGAGQDAKAEANRDANAELADSAGSASTSGQASRPAAEPLRRRSDRWFNQPVPAKTSQEPTALSQKPFVTHTIILISVIVWVLQLTTPFLTSRLAIQTDIVYLEPWRLITSGFAHSVLSPSHLLFNMLAVWLIGRMLEPLLGHLKFAAAYLLMLIGGDIAFIVLQPLGASAVGASGAIFGMFGALTVLYLIMKRPMTSIIILLLINAALPFFIPNIAWQSHLGGFLTGMLLAGVEVFAFRRTRQLNSRFSWLLYGLVLVVLLAGLALYYALTL